MALELKAFMDATSVSQARNCYSALVALPPLQQLKFEVVMKPLKRKFNVSKPRYDIFYDVEPILRDFQLEEKPCDEVSIRLRLILLLRLLCMFRGVDLARAHRNVRKGSLPYFLETQKKGRQYYAWYPIPHIEPTKCSPVMYILAYLEFTKDYTGPELFVTTPSAKGRRPLKADTINGLTTRFLHARGLQEYTAHSTRGAAATALLLKGVEPQVVQALGDWESTDCFNKFYNRLRVTKGAVAQCLVPNVNMHHAGMHPSLPCPP
jgi:hypothetical protein